MFKRIFLIDRELDGGIFFLAIRMYFAPQVLHGCVHFFSIKRVLPSLHGHLTTSKR